ncbi:MAG: cytochrome c family protein [Deltaproteobacteria bacterium]|nr:cytochrome c family protein [Deltaproteobacteria bacterium]
MNIFLRAAWICILIVPWFLCSTFIDKVRCEADKTYVGSKACMECHETEYKKFSKYAKKSHSFNSIMKMKKGLTNEEVKKCFKCHTTGYGKDSGFKSESETPHLKNAGCEVCHGPGSLHAETEDSEDIIGHLTQEICETCHNSKRVEAFHYKPMIYGGAH